MVRRLLLISMSVLVIFLVAACSGSPNGPVDVKVAAGDYNFTSSLTTFKPGVKYHFVVTNTGAVEHEFMIVKPMKAGTDMEVLDKMAIAHIEEADLQPGQTATVDYTFTQAYPSGSLEMACHLPNHYEQGMLLPIEVK